MKKKPQGSTAKKKPVPTRDTGEEKQSNAKEEVEKREKVGEEKRADGKGVIKHIYSVQKEAL